jgi:transketolase
MRYAFVDWLTKKAKRDERLWLITADLGFNLFEDFAEKFPERFINTGVAEQNAVGIASGLALGGKRPFVYSIASFITGRAYEFIKIDVGHQNQPVVIIGNGGGKAYAHLGFTHTSEEDLALMRLVPNMNVMCPEEKTEIPKLMDGILESGKPTYIRFNRGKR